MLNRRPVSFVYFKVNSIVKRNVCTSIPLIVMSCTFTFINCSTFFYVVAVVIVVCVCARNFKTKNKQTTYKNDAFTAFCFLWLGFELRFTSCICEIHTEKCILYICSERRRKQQNKKQNTRSNNSKSNSSYKNNNNNEITILLDRSNIHLMPHW